MLILYEMEYFWAESFIWWFKGKLYIVRTPHLSQKAAHAAPLAKPSIMPIRMLLLSSLKSMTKNPVVLKSSNVALLEVVPVALQRDVLLSERLRIATKKKKPTTEMTDPTMVPSRSAREVPQFELGEDVVAAEAVDVVLAKQRVLLQVEERRRGGARKSRKRMKERWSTMIGSRIRKLLLWRKTVSGRKSKNRDFSFFRKNL